MNRYKLEIHELSDTFTYPETTCYSINATDNELAKAASIEIINDHIYATKAEVICKLFLILNCSQLFVECWPKDMQNWPLESLPPQGVANEA